MEGNGNYRGSLGKKGEDIACSLLEGMGIPFWKGTGGADIWR